MSERIDMTGQRYNSLTAVSFSHSNSKQGSMWNVICDCGIEKKVCRSYLISGRTKSCGCKKIERLKAKPETVDKVGERYGRLLVLKKDPNVKKGNPQRYICQCDCGNTKSVLKSNLHIATGGVKSCGCLVTDTKISTTVSSKGYVLMRGVDHPNVNASGYIFEHRYVMSQYLGRALLDHENVHHKNGVRHDNHIDNLELWSESQPSGQRVEDLLIWARELINLYGSFEVS